MAILPLDTADTFSRKILTCASYGDSLPLPPDPFRRPKYRGPRASPTESPGNTKTGYLLGHGDVFRRGMGLLGIIFWEGIGIMAALALRAMAQREVDLEQLFAAQEVGAGCEEPRGGHWSRRVRSSCATGRIR
jgi:hypothetical protein